MPSTPTYALPYPLETDTADVPRDIQALAQRLEVVLPTASVGVPTGAGIDWFATGVPAGGFLLADGSAVSRTTYAALYAKLGVIWGPGDGSTTFNLPDTRGRVVVGVAAGGNSEVAALGANDGTAAAARRVRHAHTTALTLPDHWHNVYDPTHGHSAGTTAAYNYGNQGGNNNVQAGTPHIQIANVALGTTVNGAATGIQVQSPQSFPGIGGAVGVTGGTADGPSFVVAAKAIKT